MIRACTGGTNEGGNSCTGTKSSDAGFPFSLLLKPHPVEYASKQPALLQEFYLCITSLHAFAVQLLNCYEDNVPNIKNTDCVTSHLHIAIVVDKYLPFSQQTQSDSCTWHLHTALHTESTVAMFPHSSLSTKKEVLYLFQL